jgi:hypothetical protein
VHRVTSRQQRRPEIDSAQALERIVKAERRKLTGLFRKFTGLFRKFTGLFCV